MRQSADDTDGLGSVGDARRDRPLANGDLAVRPLDRLQAPGMHPHQREVFVFVHAEYLRTYLFLRSEPAGQFAFLEFAGLGKRQTTGIHYGAQGHGRTIHIELNNGIASGLGHRRKGAQGSFATPKAVAGQRGSNDGIRRDGKRRQQSQREQEGRHPVSAS